MSTRARPNLHFESLAEMMADVDRLRAGSWEKSGNWDLGMILDHLAKSLDGPFRPGRNLPWPLGPVARLVIRRFARRKTYPNLKLPVPKMIRPNPEVSADAAYAELAVAVGKLQALPGPTVVCPPFGRIRLDDFLKVMLLHAAHHLGFLKPV